MSNVASRLAALKLTIPAPSAPAGAYVPAVRAGELVFTSGQLPLEGGVLLATGLVGEDVTLEDAAACARCCALNALAALTTVCELDAIGQVVKLVGYVASAQGFTAQPTVINGASDVMIAAFGGLGSHAREAVGVARLPLDAPVEVSLVVRLR